MKITHLRITQNKSMLNKVRKNIFQLSFVLQKKKKKHGLYIVQSSSASSNRYYFRDIHIRSLFNDSINSISLSWKSFKKATK